MQLSGMESNQFQEIPQTFAPGRIKKPLPKKTVVLFAFIALIILAVLFVNLTAKSEKQSTSTASTTPSATEAPIPASNAASPTPEPTVAPTPVPTPTSTPKPTPSANPVDKVTGLDRSKLSVTVKNGSGVIGAAGKAADMLKGLGYNVVSTGNADNDDFVNVSIQVKVASSDFLVLLKKDLASYTIGSNSADLSTSFSSAAPIWNKIMTMLLENVSDEPIQIPDDIIQKPCFGRIEYFVKGTETLVNCKTTPAPSPSPNINYN